MYIIEDSENKLVLDAGLGRAGIQKYIFNNDEIKVLRPLDEVEKSKNSFDNLPIFVGHPKDESERISVGKVKKVYITNGILRGKLEINNKDAIDKIKNDEYTQVSCGYKCNLKQENEQWTDTLGIHGFVDEVYDYQYKQMNIIGDHVALVPKGTARAGALASISLDSESTNNDNNYLLFDSITQTNLDINQYWGDRAMNQEKQKTVIFNDKAYNISGDDVESVIDEINNLKNRISELESQVEKKDSEIDQYQGQISGKDKELENVKNQCNELQDQVKKLQDQSTTEDNAEIAERLKLWQKVSPYLEDDNEFDYSLDSTQIKMLYLQKMGLNDELDKATKEYIDGLWYALKPDSNLVKKNSEDVSDAVRESQQQKQPKVKINRKRDVFGKNK